MLKFGNPKPFVTPDSPWSVHCRPPTLEQIKERMDRELPAQTYLTEKDLCDAIRVRAKTLKNDRAPGGAHRYPVALRFAGGEIQYLRSEVIEWMANWEMHSRTVHIHRCR